VAQTNLTTKDGKWAVEVIGGPDEETFVKTFEGREHATNWVRNLGLGKAEAPVLKPKKAAKSKTTTKAKSVKK
jgi:hypothetical protein